MKFGSFKPWPSESSTVAVGSVIVKRALGTTSDTVKEAGEPCPIIEIIAGELSVLDDTGLASGSGSITKVA